MKLSKSDINTLDKATKLNLINSLTGAKPANLIGTADKAGQENLAIISSVVHLGTTPPLLGFFLRPNPEKNRHTYQNIIESPFFTINAISVSQIKNAHATSFNYPKSESEFEACNIESEYISNFEAPFVKKSPIKIGLKHIETKVIESNNSVLIVGEIMLVETADTTIDLEDLEIAAISGLNSYYSLHKVDEQPYMIERMSRK